MRLVKPDLLGGMVQVIDAKGVGERVGLGKNIVDQRARREDTQRRLIITDSFYSVRWQLPSWVEEDTIPLFLGLGISVSLLYCCTN